MVFDSWFKSECSGMFTSFKLGKIWLNSFGGKLCRILLVSAMPLGTWLLKSFTREGKSKKEGRLLEPFLTLRPANENDQSFLLAPEGFLWLRVLVP